MRVTTALVMMGSHCWCDVAIIFAGAAHAWLALSSTPGSPPALVTHGAAVSPPERMTFTPVSGGMPCYSICVPRRSLAMRIFSV